MLATKIKLATVEIRAAYALGKRQFQGIQLPEANLRGMNLSGVDLTGANLAGADLRETNLEKANWQSANLRGANLSGANLKRACFEDANLQTVDLTGAILPEANFTRADLENANCNAADLEKAIFNYANLQGCCLTGVCLREALLENANLGDASLVGADLREVSLAGTFYSTRTCFDSDFNPMNAKMIWKDRVTIEDMVTIFTYIYQVGCKYLGKTIASKYWISTCPRLNWLESFPITADSEISFTGDRSESIGYLQLQEYRQWMNQFARSCDSIVRDFNRHLKARARNTKIHPFIDV